MYGRFSWYFLKQTRYENNHRFVACAGCLQRHGMGREIIAGKILLILSSQSTGIRFEPLASRYSEEQPEDLNNHQGQQVEMELRLINRFSIDREVRNLYTEIPGTDPKLKGGIILIGAHYDSWHGGLSDKEAFLINSERCGKSSCQFRQFWLSLYDI